MIDEIRIFPMSNKDPDAKDLRTLKFYLLEKLPKIQKGKYYYPTKPGLKFKEGSRVLVLFQYQANVWGSGILIGLEEEPKIEFGKEYQGYFQFDVESLNFFKTPIRKEELLEISEKFKRFGQSKQKLEIECLDNLEVLIKKHSNTI